MGHIVIVRHGEADRRLEDTFGEHTRMNARGEVQIRSAGAAILDATRGMTVTTVETAPSDRSAANGRLLAGTLYTAARVVQNDLLHRNASVEQLTENMSKWVFDRESGLYVAVMSGYAIRAFLAYTGQLSFQEVDVDDEYGDSIVPCGSVTTARVSDSGDIDVRNIGLNPERQTLSL